MFRWLICRLRTACCGLPTANRMPIFALCLASFVGCENSPLDFGQSVGPEPQFVAPPARWVTWSRQSDAIVFEQAGKLIVARGETLKDARAITGQGSYAHPAWSPDGKEIAYDYAVDRFHQANLFVRALDGKTVARRLTNIRTYDFMPAWSADGNWIAFQSRRSPDNNVWLVSSSGGEPRPLGSALANEGSLAWSPMGARLAYESRTTGSAEDLWVADANSGATKRFAGTDATDKMPLWRPDGDELGFLSVASKGWNVWAQGESEAEPRQITTKGNVLAFNWLQGGKAVMFLTQTGELFAQKDEKDAEPVLVRKCVSFSVSPDGRRYVYIAPVGTYYQRYVEVVPSEFLP